MNQFESAPGMWLLMRTPSASLPASNPSTNLLILPPKLFPPCRLSSLHLHGHLPGQTVTKLWFACLTFSKTNLLSQDSGEGKYSVYLQGTKQGKWAANAQRTQTPCWFYLQRIFKDDIKGESHWVCDWLMTILLIGWCWGDRVIFQEFQSLVFWLQPVWGLGACSQHVIHTFYLVEGSVLGSAKQPKDIGQDIIYSSWGGTKCLVSDLWLVRFRLLLLSLTACRLLYIFSFL